MAFPATQQSLSDGLAEARRQAASVRSRALEASAFLAANNASANYVLDILSAVKEARAKLVAIGALSGIADYAKAQYADQGLDIAAEFTALVSALADVRTWITTNFPKDASGYLLKEQFAADGGLNVRSFTPAQTAGLRTVLDALAAAVE